MGNPNPTDKTSLESSFYLADWFIDSLTNRMTRGDVEIKLEDKAMTLLVYLVQHQGELVTREQLEKTVWGETVVGYDALTSCISKLRKAFDDDPLHPQFIETIPKRGYRMVAAVSNPTPNPSSRPVSRQSPLIRQLIVVGVVGIGLLVTGLIYTGLPSTDSRQPAETETAPTTPPTPTPASNTRLPSIVVLPFTNLGNDLEQIYFSDGVTADVTTALSKLSGLFVIAPSSATAYRDQSLADQKIAGSLGVRYLLKGSIQRTGNRLRINVHLIDANRGVYLWSEKYDRDIQDIFKVQDDITHNIVSALSVKLTEDEKRRTARKYTTSIAAYDDFLKGQSLYVRSNREDNQLARVFLQQAIDRDPNFARAYGTMALTHVADGRFGWHPLPSVQLDQALQLARKATELDNELPQSHWTLGYVHIFRREYDQAIEAASRAVELDPNYADSYLTLAVGKIHHGVPDEAYRLIRKAMLLNPGHPAAYTNILGHAYFFMGKYKEAESTLRAALDRNISLLTAHVFLIATLGELGQIDEARWVAEQLKIIMPGFTAVHLTEILAVQNASEINNIKKHLQNAGL